MSCLILFVLLLIAFENSYAQQNSIQLNLLHPPVNITKTDSITEQHNKKIINEKGKLTKEVDNLQQIPVKKIEIIDSAVNKYNSSINDQTKKMVTAEQNIQQISEKYIKNVDNKIEQYNNRITKKTEKTLAKLSKWEDKIHSLLQKTNPTTAQRLFGNGQMTFSSLLQKLKQGESITRNYHAQYDAYTDKLSTSLKYMQQQEDKLDSQLIKPVSDVNTKMSQLINEKNQTEAIQQIIKERKKQLMNGVLQNLKNSKYLAKINKESFYYTETLKNYKELFKNPEKAEQTATGILNKIPAFQQFMQKNSMLASLFPSPSTGGQGTVLTGLQTRAQVQGLVQQQVAAGGSDAQQMIKQNMQQAQGQLNQLKAKLNNAGKTGDIDMPNFKPNMQKTKTFKQRLEYGSNIQFAQSNQWVSTTADIAMSVGYKINDKNTVGIGASYKLGMGSIQHINFSIQGIGLRSFMDWKLKKQLFLTGGFELNNYPALNTTSGTLSVNTIKVGSWQQSGLIGLTKKLSIKSKLFKMTNIQLLYDLLNNQHIPKSQPFLFRVGYNF